MDNATFQHYLIGLLAIGNNVSSLGAYLAQTQGMARRHIWNVIFLTTLVCFVFLVVFMLFGTAVLNFLASRSAVLRSPAVCSWAASAWK